MTIVISIAVFLVACVLIARFIMRKHYLKARFQAARWLLRNVHDEVLDMLVEDIKMARMPLELQEAHVYLAYGRKLQASEIINKYLKDHSDDKVARKMLEKCQVVS